MTSLRAARTFHVQHELGKLGGQYQVTSKLLKMRGQVADDFLGDGDHGAVLAGEVILD